MQYYTCTSKNISQYGAIVGSDWSTSCSECPHYGTVIQSDCSTSYSVQYWYKLNTSES